ncbi:MAG: hypothetical protein HYV13_03585 [Candidatus Doudnabacteria bacterium]|nr:hypothetical protein [Candidatus Doudnabacteria bacterium]
MAKEIPNSTFQIPNSQKGITLLFSVFVMSGVAIITITIGFFAVQELKASKSVVLAEPAIIAAETAGETGLWQIIRQDSMPPDCTNQNNPTELLDSSRTLNMKCMSYGSATLEIKASVDGTFFLYDPNDLNGNKNPGYEWITVTYKSGGTSLTVRVERMDATLVSSTAISPGSQPVQISLPTNPSDDNRFKVILSSAGNVTADVNTNLGMPDFPTLNAEGCATGGTDVSSCLTTSNAFRRRLQILVPR